MYFFKLSHSKSGWPATWQLIWSSSYNGTNFIPDIPFWIAFKKAGIPTPLGDTTPNPVTTTRLFIFVYPLFLLCLKTFLLQLIHWSYLSFQHNISASRNENIVFLK